MNGYIDFHSLLLPNFKGGYSDEKVLKETISSLNSAKIKTVVTTSIFDPEIDNIDEFLNLRQQSFELLKEKTKGLSLPKIILGAEVCFSEKLLKLNDINKLCIGDTDYMMISFNPKDYSKEILELLEKFIIAHDIHPIIAHLESYLDDIPKDELKKFSQMGVLTEISCSSIVDRTTRRQSLQLIEENIVQVIGSNNNVISKENRTIGNIAMDILNKDISTNVQDIVKPSPQYCDAVRIMRYNLSLGKYKHIKNNVGMIISNASLTDVLANVNN
jgi:tyrosine-protein phosphatase YwqE